MIVIMLGPPGSGKGTQAELLSRDFRFLHLAMGEIFRQEVKNKTSLGEKVNSFLKNGKLVPDALTTEVFLKLLKEKKDVQNFIFDGFPRTIAQAEALDNFLKKSQRKADFVFYFDLSLNRLIERLSGRRSCSQCGSIYHLENKPPQKDNLCDSCGISLVIREDDKEETIKRRYQLYNQSTKPLIDYYQKQNLVKTINADAPMSEIFKEISSLINIKNQKSQI